MTVKLRLLRIGKTKQPKYRLVATDSRSPRDGRFIELLGTYDPRQEPSLFNFNDEKIGQWLNQGAQPSERVQKLLIAAGLLSDEAAAKTVVGKKMARRPKKTKKVAAKEEGSASSDEKSEKTTDDATEAKPAESESEKS